MKLTTFILLLSLMQVSAASFGQRVTMKSKSVSIETIFREIQKQTGYGVVFDASSLKINKKIEVNFSSTPLDDVMLKVLEGTDMTFNLEDKNIVIKQKEKSFLNHIVQLFQEIDVTGKVLDNDGRPISGANITVKGTKKATITQMDGSFLLKEVDENSILVITYIGYESKELKVAKNVGSVRLVASTSPLDEVQVIAYGTTTKRLSTGNNATVKAEDIERQPVTNLLLALQGRVPGVVVTQNSGVPGGGVEVRIQGRNSIRNGNYPFYVIDGIPIAPQLSVPGASQIFGNSGTDASGAPEIAGNPLSFLNPDDIESIDILKDADATAIYGARAANGAILITTKKGKVGKTAISINYQNGFSYQPARLEVLNTVQYIDMRREALKNDGTLLSSLNQTGNYDLTVWDTTRYTNWQEEFLKGKPTFTRATLSFSGGSPNLTHLVSATYNQEGVPFPGDLGFRQISLNFNLSNSSFKDRLKMSFSGNFSNSKNKTVVDPTNSALFLAPNAPDPFNSDGTLNWAPNTAGVSTYTYNPFRYMSRTTQNGGNNFISNWTVGYRILPGLELKNSLGVTIGLSETLTKAPSSSYTPEERVNTQNSAFHSTGIARSWIVEPQLSYRKRIFGGNLESLIGGTINQRTNKLVNLTGTNFVSDELFENISSAAAVTSTSNIVNYKAASVFGRLNYNLKNQYILNFTMRRDGSSRFGQNNRYHNFMAIGTAWIITEYKVIKEMIPVLSFGKLRMSYGTTGNDQIADFAYFQNYNSTSLAVPYQNIAVLTATGLPNPDLQWEFNKKFSTGINLGFLNDRLLVNFDYANNIATNQLGTRPTPRFIGRDNYISNFPGVVRNRTYETSISVDVLKERKFTWSFNLNFSFAQNKLVSFPEIEKSSFAFAYVVGESLDQVELYRYAGVNPATGNYQFKTKDGALTENPVYRVDQYSVSTVPDFYGGIQNELKYKGISLSFFLQFVKQNGFEPNFGSGSSTTPGSYTNVASNNQPLFVLDRWKKPGDIASVQKYTSSSNLSSQFAYISDAGYTDASFCRLKNISLSWNLNNKWLQPLNVNSMRLFANAQNLLTFSRYKGMDPEKAVQTGLLLPPMRTIVFGASVTF